MSTVQSVLTPRWTPLKPHDRQIALWQSKARFRVVPAGRRSGKTEIAKRFLVRSALAFNAFPNGWFVCAAPTLPQARKIYWDDLKRLVPSWAVVKISETDMTIKLVNGAEISVCGMDDPQRIEGRELDGIILDEFADMKKIVWTKHVRAALSTLGRPGWAWFIGVPEGRNHYYQLYLRARADTTGEWEAFTWRSSEILDPAEIESAKRDLDPLSFDQEYNASFVNFEGRAYYSFDRDIHAAETLRYNPNLPLVFGFDFNVKPGVAIVAQEQMYKGRNPYVPRDEPISCGIGEVWVPDNSNTVIVSKKLANDWKHHEGDVYLYGDATGGARGTAKVAGSDWEIVLQILRPVFGDRLQMRYRRQNPKERVRVNSVNTRLMTADGRVKTLLDPKKCPNLINDLEGVTLVEGGSGEIDEKADPMLTHISDAWGYYIERKHPVQGDFYVASSEC